MRTSTTEIFAGKARLRVGDIRDTALLGQYRPAWLSWVGAAAAVWGETEASGVALALGSVAGLFFVILLCWLALQNNTRHSWFVADELASRQLSIETTADEIAKQIKAGGGTGPEFATFWKETYTRLNSYHAEARSQLRSAYILAQVAAAFGFVTLLVLGIIAAFAASSILTIVAGAAATVGAGLAAFISKTFQATYTQALGQRMAYFDEPVEIARLLAA
jgi:hypothetical protein